MAIRVWLFGIVRAQGADGQNVKFTTSKCRDLLAVICLAAGKPLPRSEIARILWPTANANGQAVNLRVALYSLRQTLDNHPGIQADRSRIWIEPEHIKTDLARAISLRRRAMRDPDPVVRAARLTDVAQITRSPLLADVELSLAEAARTAWHQRHLDALAQLRQLQEESGLVEEAITTAAELIEADPTQEEAVSATMRLLAGRGHRAKAIEFYRRADDQCRKRSGVGLSHEIELLANTIEGGGLPVKQSQNHGVGRPDLLSGLLGNAIARGSEIALALLVAEGRQPIVTSNATEMLEVFATAYDRAPVNSPHRIGLATAAARMAGYINNYEEVVLWAGRAIDQSVPQDPERLSSLLTRGFLHFTVRKWDEAYSDCRQVLRETQGKPSSLFHLAALANIASFDGHRLDFDGAKEKYELFLKLVNVEDNGARGQICMVRANLCFLYSMVSDWEKGLEEGEAALRYARVFEFSVGECVCGPLGLSHVMTGDVAYGIATLERGITCMHRHGYARLCQLCMEYAAIALIRVGNVQAGVSILDAIRLQREAASHARSPAEEKLVAWGLADTGEIEIDRSYRTMNQRELVARICELLAEVY